MVTHRTTSWPVGVTVHGPPVRFLLLELGGDRSLTAWSLAGEATTLAGLSIMAVFSYWEEDAGVMKILQCSSLLGLGPSRDSV